jgi:hypothetical protein
MFLLLIIIQPQIIQAISGGLLEISYVFN